MDYKGWVLSIYDEYKKQYDKKYDITKVTFKEFSKFLFSKENRKIAIFLFSFVISVIALYVLAEIGKYENAVIYMWIELILMFIILFSQNYKNELSLEIYKNKVNILREILIDEGLHDENFIKGLRNYTGGIFYKVNKKIKEIFKGIITLISLTGLNYAILKANREVAIIIVGGAIIIACISYCIYTYLTIIPNSRVIRRQLFHELLNILIAYDFESNKSIKNIDEMVVKDIEAYEKK